MYSFNQGCLLCQKAREKIEDALNFINDCLIILLSIYMHVAWPHLLTPTAA